jgi:hypothetical protein
VASWGVARWRLLDRPVVLLFRFQKGRAQPCSLEPDSLEPDSLRSGAETDAASLLFSQSRLSASFCWGQSSRPRSCVIGVLPDLQFRQVQWPVEQFAFRSTKRPRRGSPQLNDRPATGSIRPEVLAANRPPLVAKQPASNALDQTPWARFFLRSRSLRALSGMALGF